MSEPLRAAIVSFLHEGEFDMANEAEMETRFWKALKSDRTMMLGLDGVEDGHTRPMTAMVEEEGRGPIWFFTARDNGIVQALDDGQRAIATFAAKDHDLFATVHGTLWMDNDQVVIERLWNPFIAARYEGGKTDPKLALLRLDAEHAEIWLNENSLFAGAKLLLGIDPKKAYKDKVAEVNLH